MKKRIKSKFLACAVVVCGGLFSISSMQAVAATIVKFKLLRGHVIVIPVTVNGSGPFDFILDTGANTTIITAEFARAMRLRPIDRVELMTVAGSQIVPRITLAGVSVGAKSVVDMEAVINDLNEARAISPEIRGALGLNFLARFNLIINYRDRRIEFEDVDELEHRLTGERLPIEWLDDRMLIVARSMMTGGKNRRFVLDSGIGSLLLFTDDSRHLKLDWENSPPEWVEARTEVGGQMAWRRRLRSFSVGGVEFSGLPVVVLESKIAQAGRVEDGLLPISLFQEVYINYRKRFVILNPKFGERRIR